MVKVTCADCGRKLEVSKVDAAHGPVVCGKCFMKRFRK